jgi:hypothetical protein
MWWMLWPAAVLVSGPVILRVLTRRKRDRDHDR